MKAGFANEFAEKLSSLTHKEKILPRAPEPVQKKLLTLVISENKPPKVVQPAKLVESPAVFQRWKARQKKSKVSKAVLNWHHIRLSILERDEYTCRICGADPCDEQLHVHHVDWDRSNNRPRNLVTLCAPCHKAIHYHGYRPDGQDQEPWGDRGPRE